MDRKPIVLPAIIGLSFFLTSLLVSAKDGSLGLTENQYLNFVLSILVAFAVDMVVRLARDRRTKQEISGILGHLERAEDLLPNFANLAADVDAIVDEYERDSPVYGAAERVLRRGSQDLGELRSGLVRTPYFDTRISMELLDTVEDLRAVSISDTDLSFWIRDPEGQRYWEANRHAIDKRKANIQRVFVYRHWSPDLLRVVDAQLSAGVHVRVLRIPTDRIDAQSIVDFAVFDRRVSRETEVNAAHEPVANRFHFRRDQVSKHLDLFELLFSAAVEPPARDSFRHSELGQKPQIVPAATLTVDDLYALDSRIFDGYSRVAVRQFLELFGPGYRVAMVDGVSVGYALTAAIPGRQACWLLALGVLPEARRQGHAARLLDDSIAIARRGGSSSMRLTVSQENAAAIALYEAAGFRTTSRHSAYFGSGEDRVEMSANLE